MFDVLIRNGTVVDGLGKPRFVSDVGVENGRITLVGHANGAMAAREIDATGKIVCPGFVDPHSHADLSIFRENHAQILEPLVRQGITTFIGGNCGLSLAPLGNKHPETARQYIETFTPFDWDREVVWRSMGEFLDTLDSRGVLLNVGVLAPHGLMRISALGPDMPAATEQDLRDMARDLERAMEEGALGLSAGLQYIPGSLCDTRELVYLGQVLKAYDGVFACHLRSYSNTLPRAVDEVIEVARTNGIPAQISHIFWVPNWGWFGRPMRAMVRKLARLSEWWTPPLPLDGPMAARIDQVQAARKQGVRVGIDVMPTTTAFTHVLAFFPPWVVAGGVEQALGRLRDPDQRARMRRAIEYGKMEWPHVAGDSWSLNLIQLMGWESIRIMKVVSEQNRRYEGMSLTAIAEERKKHPCDALCDLLIEEDGHVLAFASMARPDDNLTERSTFAAIRHPEVTISTDTILLGMGRPSYLFYGCYPKFLGRYVRDKKMLDLETAIRKITSLPADHFHLKGRGRVETGAWADLVIFDLDRIASRAAFEEPDRFPVGIEHVFINGKLVVEGDTFHGDRRAGCVLRNGGNGTAA